MESILTEGSTVELLLVFAIVFIATYLLYQRYTVSDSRHRMPPAVPSIPLVGSLPFLPAMTMGDLAEFCIAPHNKYGKIFSFRAGSKYDILLVIC